MGQNALLNFTWQPHYLGIYSSGVGHYCHSCRTQRFARVSPQMGEEIISNVDVRVNHWRKHLLYSLRFHRLCNYRLKPLAWLTESIYFTMQPSPWPALRYGAAFKGSSLHPTASRYSLPLQRRSQSSTKNWLPTMGTSRLQKFLLHHH